MGYGSQEAKLVTPNDYQNLARPYRSMAATLRDGAYRERLLQMARTAEDRQGPFHSSATKEPKLNRHGEAVALGTPVTPVSRIPGVGRNQRSRFHTRLGSGIVSVRPPDYGDTRPQ